MPALGPLSNVTTTVGVPLAGVLVAAGGSEAEPLDGGAPEPAGSVGTGGSVGIPGSVGTGGSVGTTGRVGSALDGRLRRDRHAARGEQACGSDSQQRPSHRRRMLAARIRAKWPKACAC